MIRVNEVIMIRIDGASDRTVIKRTSWIIRPDTVPSPSCPRSMEIFCAHAMAGFITIIAVIVSARMEITRRGRRIERFGIVRNRLNIIGIIQRFDAGFNEGFGVWPKYHQMLLLIALNEDKAAAGIERQGFDQL